MNEKFNKNAKVEQITKMLGRVSVLLLYFLSTCEWWYTYVYAEGGNYEMAFIMYIHVIRLSGRVVKLIYTLKVMNYI